MPQIGRKLEQIVSDWRTEMANGDLSLLEGWLLDAEIYWVMRAASLQIKEAEALKMLKAMFSITMSHLEMQLKLSQRKIEQKLIQKKLTQVEADKKLKELKASEDNMKLPQVVSRKLSDEDLKLFMSGQNSLFLRLTLEYMENQVKRVTQMEARVATEIKELLEAKKAK